MLQLEISVQLLSVSRYRRDAGVFIQFPTTQWPCALRSITASPLASASRRAPPICLSGLIRCWASSRSPTTSALKTLARSQRSYSRDWVIHDEAAGDSVVEGDGVVGEQPRLKPTEVHEYRSFCVLTAPHGWMEGSFHFVRDNRSAFDAAIPRFIFAAESREDTVN